MHNNDNQQSNKNKPISIEFMLPALGAPPPASSVIAVIATYMLKTHIHASIETNTSFCFNIYSVSYNLSVSNQNVVNT